MHEAAAIAELGDRQHIAYRETRPDPSQPRTGSANTTQGIRRQQEGQRSAETAVSSISMPSAGVEWIGPVECCGIAAHRRFKER